MIAVVSGASRGIGRAIAERLAGDGSTVIMLARGRDALERAAREIGASAVAHPCDVADRDSLLNAAAAIAATHGAPDIIVNNAGSFALDSIETTPVDRFIDTIETNLVAPFLLVRTFLPRMRERGSGHIVTIGSIADRAVFPENGAYAASKHGLRALHEVMRAELRGSGVRATLISPAPVDTGLWDPIDPDARAGFTPRAAMLSPRDVAAAVAFAVSQPATVNVDELRLSRS